MTGDLDLARRFYRALHSGDGKDLMALLHPEFVGHVTEGLPAGLGGTYRGPEAMLWDCWRRAAEIFHARPEPEQFFESDGSWIIVRGRYVSSPGAPGEGLDAVFAHFLNFRDQQLVELWQVTDSSRWELAIGSHKA
jgi:ketosteroid isomerase-like protein